jgi:hypothetical protein
MICRRAQFLIFAVPLLVALAASRASAACDPTALAGPFCIDGDDPGNHHPTSGLAGQTNATDPLSASGVKELSATNGNIYKLYNINYATPPGVLNLVSMPDKVDLVNVATQSALDTSTGHLWFYFAWTRSTTAGSGFITVELEKNGLNITNCNYGAVTDFTNAKDPGIVALIANCNPWAGRQDNDLLISWNQVGNTNLTLGVQHFCATGSQRQDCQGITLPSWGAVTQAFTFSKAAFCDPSGNSFCGEAAIDLSALQGGTSCTSFANILPNTVTGNTLDFRATSDYKDTVFFNFPPVANCGKLTVTKRLLDGDGKTLLDQTPTFAYRVDRATLNQRLRNDLDVASPADCTAAQNLLDHCMDGPAPQVKIERPNSVTPNGGVALHAGVTQVHTDLIPGTNYQLVESSITPSTLYSLINVVCMDTAPTSSTTLAAAIVNNTATSITVNNAIATGTYINIDSETLLVTAGGGTTLTVERGQLGTTAASHANGATVYTRATKTVSNTLDTPGATNFVIAVPDTVTGFQQTDCVITNQFVKGNASMRTEQRAKVNDTAYITLDNALTASDTAGKVTIKLYSGDNCGVTTGSLLKTKEFTFTLGQIVSGTFNVTTGDGDFTSEENKAAVIFPVTQGETKFSWTADYAGDAKNNAVQGGCKEAITININNNK